MELLEDVCKPDWRQHQQTYLDVVRGARVRYCGAGWLYMYAVLCPACTVAYVRTLSRAALKCHPIKPVVAMVGQQLCGSQGRQPTSYLRAHVDRKMRAEQQSCTTHHTNTHSCKHALLTCHFHVVQPLFFFLAEQIDLAGKQAEEEPASCIAYDW
jgi:hypothetical protein